MNRSQNAGLARKVIHRGSSWSTGLLTSRKMNRCVPWESPVERDFIHLLEYNRDVKAYFAQPFKIDFHFDGRGCTYFPDFRVEFVGGGEVIYEVKPEAELKEPDVRKRMDAIELYFERRGMSFEIETDLKIRRGLRLKNIKTLFPYLYDNPGSREILAL